MRKSHEKVVRAFMHGKAARAGNVWTDGNRVELFGNAVAIRSPSGKVEVSWAGWVTPTTAAVLNALSECAGSRMGFYRRRGQAWATCDGHEFRVGEKAWVEL